MPFSESQALAVRNFYHHVLKYTADEWYGQSFVLSPWQRDAVNAVFGERRDDGRRQIEFVYLEVPKKSGKTEFIAGMLLYVLVTNPNPGCQVYGAASAQKQAKNVFRAATKMVEQSEILSDELRILRSTNRIVRRNDPESYYEAIAGDGDVSDGINPAFVVCDEVHRWKTRKQQENYDILTAGGITRKSPLSVCITTAGVVDESPIAWRLHEKTRKIDDGSLRPDPTFYGRIYGADIKEDWTSPAVWIKANPSLIENGGFLPLQKIREKYEAAVGDRDAERAFKRYFLNMWDQKAERAIDMEQWHACRSDFQATGLLPKSPDGEVRRFPHEFLTHFVDRPCWLGVDLSLTTDMSAVTAVFPHGEGFEFLPFFYMATGGKASLRKREARDGVPYRSWVEDGFLEVHEGGVIDYGEVKRRILWACEMFDVQEICFDRANSREMSTALISDYGLQCFEVPQTFTGLSEATKKLLALITAGTCHHGNHPILTWNAGCMSVDEKNDQMKPIKPARQQSSSRIDGIAAGLNALSHAVLAGAQESAYASGEVVI